MTKGAYIGPFQRIVNVGWNVGTEIATLQWDSDFISSFGRSWAATLSFPQLGFVADLFRDLSSIIPQSSGGIVTPTLRGKNTWEYPTIKTDSTFQSGGGTVTIVDRGQYFLLTDRGIVTSWIDPLLGELVPFFWDHNGDTSGGALNDSEVNGLLGEAVGRICGTLPSPYLNEIVTSHDVTVDAIVHNEEFRRVFMFLNMNRIKALLPTQTTFRVVIETGNTLSATHESLIWEATVATWKNRLAFPVTPAPDYSPLYGFPISFAPPPFPDGSLTLNAGGNESRVAAATVEFDINLTNYAVTGSRVDH